MKNKIFIFSFAILFLISLLIPTNIYASTENGEILRDLGVLIGDLSNNLNLNQEMKRQDGIVLLSRLLGEEEEAKNYKGIPSFTDIKDPFYNPYIAWAEDKGLTEGIGNGLFGFNLPLTKQQILAFMLRALGYEFYGVEYSKVPEKALELEIINDIKELDKSSTRDYVSDVT